MQMTVSKQAVVRVFVACTTSEWLPMRVLEFSMRETSALPVEVRSIASFNRQIPQPRDLRNQPRTPFSFQRFLIPELCGFKGRAIYLDADMQVFTNINALWSHPMADHDLLAVSEGNDGRRGQFSVMLLDCERLRWNVDEIVAELDAGSLTYAQLMYEMRVASSVGHDLPPEWNSLERYDGEKTCLLHYTDMNTQPWISTKNPLENLWVACLRRAITAGFISREELQREVEFGHVRPSLLIQVDAGLDRSQDLSAEARRVDRFFVPPYRRLKAQQARPWISIRAAISALLQKLYYSSPLPRLFGRR
jgi:hypothetical protein